MSFALYIARRYTISRSKSTAINIITGIAATGIIVSTAALFVILSVFSGLKDYSLSFSNTTDPDLKLSTLKGKSFMMSSKQEQEIKQVKGIAVYSKVVEERVLFYFDEKEQVATMKGVDSLFTRVNPIQKSVFGQWLMPNSIQVVPGRGITNKLSMGLSDFTHPMEVFVPKAGKGAIQNPDDAFNKTVLAPVGIYNINDDLDTKYVYTDLGLAQELLEFKPNQLTSLEFKLAAGADENDVRQKLETIFGDKVVVKNREQLNDSLYKMLNAENLVTYLFCSLVVVLTLFCLAGALIMLILDKKENIKTLYGLGAEIKSLRSIFFYQGIFITALGATFGVALGIAIVFIQQKYSLVMITNTMAYPVNFNAMNIVIVLVTIFTLGILASRIAAGTVGKKLLKST
ncbi:FtsX-like permease family protein [Flavobacterium sp. DG1-102-2]|uniref:ABC transporter permease n=1 Tax=Flavobacterium sp. DG1-102-2 TaxID=3081663 RepID=UPI00294983C1|nr:FtsX-like permease family protein [Flavobacterium sp. DG1-102-2]MDV6169678.1 FtsX-like permease family protein [Flavobacterium sp. DG1-102-2]